MKSNITDINNNLDILKRPLSVLSSVNEDIFGTLSKINVVTILDILFYFPISIKKRIFCKNVKDFKLKQVCVIKAKAVSYLQARNKLEIVCEDESGHSFSVLYFNRYPKYILNYYPLNTDIILIGSIDIFNNLLCMSHPEKVQRYSKENIDCISKIEIKYKRHLSISSEKFSEIIKQALATLNTVDFTDCYSCETRNLFNTAEDISFKDAINYIHNPQTQQDLDPNNKYYQKLAFEEMVVFHLKVLIQRINTETLKYIKINTSSEMVDKYIGILPFELSLSQKHAISSMQEFFQNDSKASTLLQGDVGSGKTVVCNIAAMEAVSNCYQVAFMAPTDILCTQHFEGLKPYAQQLGLNIEIIRGKDKASHKKLVKNKLINHEIDIIFGTHALIQDTIEFKNLGLIIIDEQHKFGVNQRFMLSNKGDNPKIILTTATPIPRSLALSMYGDINTVIIKDKPLERSEILTLVKPLDKLNELILSVKSGIKEGKKFFWVCPLINESEKLPYASALARYMFLEDIFKKDIYLMHGKQSFTEKNQIINDFKDTKKGSILVSTTVIEVGIDIPTCNVIIIENSEKFGLAQLHQLRGRVGRGKEQGICILLYDSQKISKTGVKRLNILKNSNDGFYIAEQDLKTRGAGDILSTQQSGYEYFKIANLNNHHELLIPSIKEAKFLYDIYQNNKNSKQKIHNFLLLYSGHENTNYLKLG